MAKMPIIDHIDLELAWSKTKSNLRDNSRVFINNPYLLEILDSNYEDWMDYLSERFSGEYQGSDARTVNVPKAGWNIRPGTVLELEDLVLYSGIVLEMYDTIRSNIEWSAGERRFSRILLDEKSENGGCPTNPLH